MDRLVRLNVIAKSGRAVEAAGDVHVLLLDKTGTITFGNRRCAAVYAAPGVTPKELGEGALLASLADDTAEGKSIVGFLREQHPMNEPTLGSVTAVPFSADTRLSGVDYQGHVYRKGAVDSLLAFINMQRSELPPALARESRQDRQDRWHAVAGLRQWPAAGRDSPQGRGQAGHSRAF